MNDYPEFKTVTESLQRARHIFLTAHQNCPDAIASICSVGNYLQARQKKFYPYLTEPVPKNLRDLSGAAGIQCIRPNLRLFDVLLIVDAGDLKQTGLESELRALSERRQTLIINIDHHKTNDAFGHINILDEHASSTCELIYRWFDSLNYEISSPIADCLLTGIIGDTGNFTNAATHRETLEIAANLIWRGANLFHVIQRLVSVEESINTLRLWGRIFQRLTYNHNYDIAVSYVLQKDLTECSASEEAVEVVANYLNYIRRIKAGILLKEKPDGTFKVSLRSTYPGIDVSRLAKILGGGGHQKAAGFTISNYAIL